MVIFLDCVYSCIEFLFGYNNIWSLCAFSADGAYREGDLRLVGGPHNWEGRVEIYWNGTWGSISDSSWSSTDAKVVCSQLQHSTNGMRKTIMIFRMADVVHRLKVYHFWSTIRTPGQLL